MSAAPFHIVAAVNDTCDAGMNKGARAHDARLERDVDRGPNQAPRADDT